MDKWMEKVWKYKLDHILFWVALSLYFLVNQKHLIGIGGLQYYLKESFFKVLLLAFLTYSNLSFLFPYLLQRKKYVLYLLSIAGVISVYVYFRNHQDLYYFKHLLAVPGYTFHSSTLPNISNALLFICFGIAVKLSKQYFLQQQQMDKIKIEKLDAELKYLKAQINPHSLFNSINSIFSLIDKSNSEARAVLAKFSELLRYQLYDCSRDKVDIEQELQYLQNFIELQELRKGSNLSVSFNVSKNVHGFK
ncbi:MAG: histidine kinase, partial [Flavisolibacter sp.]|nr:histidine kinase [Flavisolibacter sp.]